MRKAFKREPVEPLIITVRGHRVVLDADLARPGDFAFQLTRAELENLRSQIAISSSQDTDYAKAFSSWWQLLISSHGGRRYLPWVFTEHGALMAANILRSERAVHMSVFVVRAFIRQREQLGANAAILKRLAEIDKTLLQHDVALRDLYRKLLPLLQPPADPPKRRIGFHTGTD
jgi:hypothetical protein